MDQIDRRELQRLERDRRYAERQERQLDIELLQQRQREIDRLADSLHIELGQRNRDDRQYAYEDDRRDIDRQYSSYERDEDNVFDNVEEEQRYEDEMYIEDIAAHDLPGDLLEANESFEQSQGERGLDYAGIPPDPYIERHGERGSVAEHTAALRTPSFLKDYDSILQEHEGIKDNPERVLRRKGTTRSQNPNPEEKYKADNMIERLKLLQLEADRMVKERQDRSLEENKVAESIKRMEIRNKALNEEMLKRKAMLKLRKDEERVIKILEQKKLEEGEQKKKLEMMYRRQEELKSEFRLIDRELTKEMERMNDRKDTLGNEDVTDRSETELLKLANSKKECSRKETVIKYDLHSIPTTNTREMQIMPDSSREQPYEGKALKDQSTQRELPSTLQNIESRGVESQASCYASYQLDEREKERKCNLSDRSLEKSIDNANSYTLPKRMEQNEDLIYNRDKDMSAREIEILKKEKYLKELEKDLEMKEKEIRSRFEKLPTVT